VDEREARAPLERAWSSGEAMSTAQAVGYALASP
jgi:hypothetical protein